MSVPSLSISPLIDVQSEFHPVSLSVDQVSKLQTFICSVNTLCLNVARIAPVKKVLFWAGYTVINATIGNLFVKSL